MSCSRIECSEYEPWRQARQLLHATRTAVSWRLVYTKTRMLLMMAVVSIVELMQSLSLLTLELRASVYNCRARWRDDFSRSVERPWPCQKTIKPMSTMSMGSTEF